MLHFDVTKLMIHHSRGFSGCAVIYCVADSVIPVLNLPQNPQPVASDNWNQWHTGVSLTGGLVDLVSAEILKQITNRRLQSCGK